MSQRKFSTACGAVLLAGALPVMAGPSLELVLDETPIALASMSYDPASRLIGATPQKAFTCGGSQGQIGNGLVLSIDGHDIQLASMRFSRSGGVTRVIATTPGELSTCGPEGLIFQDYFR